MSRFLDVNQKAFLDDNATIYETLVKITIGADSVYYTTGSIDVTPTVGADTAGLTFVANNMIKALMIFQKKHWVQVLELEWF